jgi:hypothetical protein
LSRTLDQLNKRYGADKVYFAGMHGMASAAPTRIAFNQIPDFTDHPSFASDAVGARPETPS